jgi:hypothetical protein
MFFYAGASLAQPVWNALFESAEREVGERIVMTCGLGMTESGRQKNCFINMSWMQRALQNVLWRNRNHVRGIKKTGL